MVGFVSRVVQTMNEMRGPESVIETSVCIYELCFVIKK